MEQKPKKPFYKKWWFWVLAVIVIGAIGSGGEDQSQQTQTAQQTPQPAAQPQQNAQPASAPTEAQKTEAPAPAKTYKVGEVVPVEKFTYTVNKVSNQKKIGNDFMNKTTEGTFLVINVSIKNGDKEARMMDTSLFKIKDANGTEYDPFAEGDMYVNKDPLFLSNVNPGLTKKANIVFELPTDAKGLQLEVNSGVGTAAGKTELINLGK
ncbi:DUF4352 domain-containing protein [Aneurinibacillus thermoaerophilus]|uniref:DUF4352 domain-containing protein n=1 Tax=Aneurinibacillus thermoaerophilus TaxID=143495 RepID=UPI002E1C465D|nr:DUF4352 domain-containing protein [Aneurinibacillus thermoaerophilus]MED0738912.1 DUF4352 domain-containing protein [Aneurinibacillus thermoaerophilus]MED0766213.1 DUF4352 domain-containing protein [Aneurinibacillus thermoaerophilus]